VLHLVAFLHQPSIDIISPVLDARFRFKRVTLLCETERLADARNTARLLQQQSINVVVLPVRPSWTPSSVKEVLTRVVASRLDKFVMNLSGASPLQSSVAQTFANANNLPTFVVQPDNDEIIWLSPPVGNFDTDDSSISDELNLEGYFSLFGHQWIGCQYRLGTRDSQKEQLAKNLLKIAINEPSVIQILNRAGSELDSGYVSQVLTPPPTRHLHSLIMQSGIARVCSDNRIDFKNGDTRAFLCGGWLEVAVLTEIAELRTLGVPIQDAACGVRIKTENGVANEYDLAVLANNQLYLAECKTVLGERRKSLGMEVIFKLDSVTRLGGMDAKGMLITLGSPSEAELQRADLQDIKMIYGDNLACMRDHLEAWLI